MKDYTRVLPRDLFNEANLLKCLGRLCLMIHDNQIKGITFEHDGDSFIIEQCQDSGALYCSNIQFFDNAGNVLYFYRTLNSRDNYPLYCDINEDAQRVFDEDGNFILTINQ